MKLSYDGEFRERWASRRQLAVELISAAAAGISIEEQFESLKRASGYDRLSEQDQANFRRFCSDVRAIFSGWSRLKPYERQSFLEGRTIYSMVAKQIREQGA